MGTSGLDPFGPFLLIEPTPQRPQTRQVRTPIRLRPVLNKAPVQIRIRRIEVHANRALGINRDAIQAHVPLWIGAHDNQALDNLKRTIANHLVRHHVRMVRRGRLERVQFPRRQRPGAPQLRGVLVAPALGVQHQRVVQLVLLWRDVMHAVRCDVFDKL